MSKRLRANVLYRGEPPKTVEMVCQFLEDKNAWLVGWTSGSTPAYDYVEGVPWVAPSWHEPAWRETWEKIHALPGESGPIPDMPFFLLAPPVSQHEYEGAKRSWFWVYLGAVLVVAAIFISGQYFWGALT